LPKSIHAFIIAFTTAVMVPLAPDIIYGASLSC
jgi:hypothetical protein